MPWLAILQTLATLVPAFDRNSAQSQKVSSLIAELSQFGQAVTSGFKPPRDLQAIIDDINLLVTNLPANAAALFPGLATVQEDVQKYAAWEHDLATGQAVVLGSYNAPVAGNPDAYMVTFLKGGPAAAAIFG
jgi:hypothetical protein